MYRPVKNIIMTRTEPCKRIGLYLPVRLCDEIQDLASQMETSMSSVVESALEKEKLILQELIQKKKDNA